MHYKVVLPDRTDFELERHEALNEGDAVTHMETTFRVKEILSGDDEFHAVVEAEPIGRPKAGPGAFTTGYATHLLGPAVWPHREKDEEQEPEGV